MKRFFWNLQVAWHLWRVGRMPLRIGMQVARASDDSFNDGCLAWETADTEMSYWEE